MNPHAARLAATLVTTALAACGAPRANEGTATRAFPIVGGQASPSPDDDAVVLLRHEALGTEAICTATLIAPNLVATVRHCVTYKGEGDYQCTLRGELIEGPEGGGHLGANVPASAIEIHVGKVASATPAAHGKQIVSTLSLTSCIDDLAFVVLDQPVPGPVATVRLGKQTRVGEVVTVVGYGDQGSGKVDWLVTPRMKVTGKAIFAVGPDSALGPVPAVIPRTFEIQGPSVCEGDSGGPALSEKTGAVVGVYSNKNHGSCTNPDIVQSYTDLSRFKSLVLDAFTVAGAVPQGEPLGLALGEVCSQASDCEHGECAKGADGVSRCALRCSAEVPCPSGSVCLASSDDTGKFCMQPDAGTSSCPLCDAAVAPPSPSAATGGCTLTRCPATSRWHLLGLVLVLGSVVLGGQRRFICRRSRSSRPSSLR